MGEFGICGDGGQWIRECSFVSSTKKKEESVWEGNSIKLDWLKKAERRTCVC